MPAIGSRGDRTYRTPECIQWRQKQQSAELRQDLRRRAGEEIPARDLSKARREAARARMAELDLGEREGELVRWEVVEDVVGRELLDRLRAAIMNVPGRWGAQLVGLESPREAQAVLKQMTREFLDHLSGPLADRFAAREDDRELPEDFPGREALLRAGIERLTDLSGLEDFEDVHGIGPVTSEQIEAELIDLVG